MTPISDNKTTRGANSRPDGAGSAGVVTATDPRKQKKRQRKRKVRRGGSSSIAWRWLCFGALFTLAGIAGFIARGFTDLRLEFLLCFLFIAGVVIDGCCFVLEFLLHIILKTEFDFQPQIPGMLGLSQAQLQEGPGMLFLGWLAGSAGVLTGIGVALLTVGIALSMYRSDRMLVIKLLGRLFKLITCVVILSGVAGLIISCFVPWRVTFGEIGTDVTANMSFSQIVLGFLAKRGPFLIALGLLPVLIKLLLSGLNRLLPDPGKESTYTTILYMLCVCSFVVGLFGVIQSLFLDMRPAAESFLSDDYLSHWLSPSNWLRLLWMFPCLECVTLLTGSVLCGGLYVYSCRVDTRGTKRSVSKKWDTRITVILGVISLALSVFISRPLYDMVMDNLFGASIYTYAGQDSMLPVVMKCATYVGIFLCSLCWLFAWKHFILCAATSSRRVLAMLTLPLYIILSAGMTAVLLLLLGTVLGIVMFGVVLFVVCRFLVMHQIFSQIRDTEDLFSRASPDELEYAREMREAYNIGDLKEFWRLNEYYQHAREHREDWWL